MDYQKNAGTWGNSFMFPKSDIYNGLQDSIQSKSMLTDDRLAALYNIALTCSKLDGDFAEIGCHNGGTSFLLASVLRSPHKLHAFDSFEGLSEPTVRDMVDNKQRYHKGYSKADKSVVSEYLNSHCGKIIIHDGWIVDTINDVSNIKFSLVYLDVDLYEPTKISIESIWGNIVNGGYIVFDDYMWADTPGIKNAVDEFFGDLFQYNHYFLYPQLGVMKK